MTNWFILLESPMLSLASHQWSELNHAYGSAVDIPALLKALEGFPPHEDYDAEPYFTLWSALCHQGDIYSASYASVPHIVRIIGQEPERSPWTLFQLIACIEIARSQSHGPVVPPDLLDAYRDSLARIPELVGRAAKGNWDHLYCEAALAAVAAAKGFCSLAEALLELDPPSIDNFLRYKFEQ